MAKIEILLYGLRKGETEQYKEDLLATNCRNEEDVEKVKEVAAKDGFHSFRVTTWDGSPPNFAGTVAI
jgi:hypothetical protein